MELLDAIFFFNPSNAFCNVSPGFLNIQANATMPKDAASEIHSPIPGCRIPNGSEAPASLETMESRAIAPAASVMSQSVLSSGLAWSPMMANAPTAAKRKKTSTPIP